MKIKLFPARSLFAAAIFSLLPCTGAIAQTLYQQNLDSTGNTYSSQNDTAPGGRGNYVTQYDNFTLGTAGLVNNVTWIGALYPAGQGTITAFTIRFWADAAGQPGGLLNSFSIAGNASQTFLGVFGPSSMYTYSANLSSDFTALAGTQYWLSIVPDLSLPDQWGWATGTGGDGLHVQDLNGGRFPISTDLTFSLKHTVVPESKTIVLLGLGSILLAVPTIRRLRSTRGT